MSDCPFCDQDVIDLQCVHVTSNEYVLHNIRPAARGQMLVIPRRHVTAIRLLPPDEFQSLATTVQRIANDLMEHMRPKPIGLNYGSNEGEWAGQSVEHAHVHLLPRYENDNIPQFHLFHRDPRTKRNLTHEELRPEVVYFRDLFAGI